MTPTTKTTNDYAAIDSFLEQLSQQVTAGRDLTIYRLSDGSYIGTEPPISDYDSVIHKGDLREEAARIRTQASRLFSQQKLSTAAHSAINHELDDQLEALLASGERHLAASRASAAPWSKQWSAKQRVELRELIHTGSELEPRLKRLRMAASEEERGCISFQVACCDIKVTVPERGEPLARMNYLGSGAFKSVRKIQGIFTADMGAVAKGGNLRAEKEQVACFAHNDGVVQLMPVADRSSNRYYMQFHGRTLCSILSEPIPAVKLVEAGLQLSRGLRAIADRQLVHNDFHDENILINWNPQTERISAVVSDLGIMSRLGQGYANNKARLISHLRNWWSWSQPAGSNPFDNVPRLDTWVKITAFLEDLKRTLGPAR